MKMTADWTRSRRRRPRSGVVDIRPGPHNIRNSRFINETVGARTPTNHLVPSPFTPIVVANRYTVPAIDRALTVLQCLARSRDGLRQSAIAEATDIPKSTLFRIMTTLEEQGCVVRDEDEKTYRLGLTVWELGNAFLNQSTLLETAETHMKRVADACEESIFLGMLDDGEVIYVRRVESPKSAVVVRKLGQRAPVYCTATGLSMLAFLPSDEAARILDEQELQAHAPNTTTNRSDLTRTLEEIRHTGVAVVDGEYNPSLLCVSAPILNADERPVASLTAALLSAAATDDDIDAMKSQIKGTAQALSTECGYLGNRLSEPECSS